jgi:hypothetical protein
MPITLTEVISPNVALDIRSAGLPIGAGGVALAFALHDGPLAFALSDREARWLVGEIERQLTLAAPSECAQG